MKNVKLMLALSLLLMGGQAMAVTTAEAKDVVGQIQTAMPTVKAIGKFALEQIPALKGKTDDFFKYVELGLNFADFGLNAEPKVVAAKDALKAWLMAVSESEAKINALKSQLAGATPDKQLAIVLAINKAGLDQLALGAEFFKKGGKDLFAQLLVLLEGLPGPIKQKLTYADGSTMGAQLGNAINALDGFIAFDKNAVVPKIEALLQNQGLAKEPVSAPVQTQNAYGSL